PGTPDEVSALLDEIHGWTSGHPYMTQRICSDLVGRRREMAVAGVVRARFLDKGKGERDEGEDANLAHGRRFLDARAGTEVPRLLSLYGRVLEGEVIPVDRGDPLQIMLSLAGLVGEWEEEDGRQLVVRNRIFREVYGPEWLRERMAARPLAAA